MKRTALKHNTKPIRRNSPLKRTINALKRSRLKRKPTKRRPEDVNEAFLAWLRETWPCYVCFVRYCNANILGKARAGAKRSVRVASPAVP